MPTRPLPRDPRQPFGRPSDPAAGTTAHQGRAQGHPPQPGQAPRAVHIDQFAPPPQRNRWWVPLLALLLLSLLAWGAVRFNQRPAPPSESVATPSPGASTGPLRPAPTTISSAVASRVPFTNDQDDSVGSFRIVDHSWTGEGLLLTVSVSLDQGSQKLGFFALDNNSTQESNPTALGTDDLQDRRIVAGQTLTGSVFFRKPKGDTTVFLTDTSGRQVAALVVRG